MAIPPMSSMSHNNLEFLNFSLGTIFLSPHSRRCSLQVINGIPREWLFCLWIQNWVSLLCASWWGEREWLLCISPIYHHLLSLRACPKNCSMIAGVFFHPVERLCMMILCSVLTPNTQSQHAVSDQFFDIDSRTWLQEKCAGEWKKEKRSNKKKNTKTHSYNEIYRNKIIIIIGPHRTISFSLNTLLYIL